MTNREIAAQVAKELHEARLKVQMTAQTFTLGMATGIIEGVLDKLSVGANPAKKPLKTIPAEAEQIYALYPKKVAPRAAKQAIIKAAERIKEQHEKPFAYLIERTRLFGSAVALWPSDERKFCPHPTTFFNQDGFDSDSAEWIRGNTSATSSKKMNFA